MKLKKLTDAYDRIKFTREAAAVRRCHTQPVIGTYDVGQHTFNMLTMLRVLFPDAPVELLWAITLHDLPERWTGDVPAPTKWKSPRVKNELVKLEADVTAATGLQEPTLSPELLSWLKGLDMLELYLWALDQRDMGNAKIKIMITRIEKWLDEETLVMPKQVKEIFIKARHGSTCLVGELED